MSTQCWTTPPRCTPPPPMLSCFMPRQSRSPVGLCRLALAMSGTTGSLCTLWQRASACARSDAPSASLYLSVSSATRR
eukprot:2372343-Prymnesium_polylepis.1